MASELKRDVKNTVPHYEQWKSNMANRNSENDKGENT